jgi:hypothetical protein
VVAAVAGAALYRCALRRRIVNRGATPAEAAARLPGDDLLASPDETTTRAISIDAPPAAVWPWIAQMGPAPRGGAYTYDWIENALGLDMHSTDEVLEQFQDPKVGEEISYGPNAMRLAQVETGRSLSWLSADGNWLWTFVVVEDGTRSRLISRNSFRLPSVTMRLGLAPMEIGSLVMERKMLRGIKTRAEALASSTRRP